MLTIAGLLVIGAVLKISRGYLVALSAAQFEQTATINAVRNILRKPPGEIEEEPPIIHFDRLGAIGKLGEFYGGEGRLLLLDLPFVPVILTLIGLIAGPLVLVPLVLLALYAVFVAIIGRRLKRVAQSRETASNLKYDFVIETLNAIQTVKAYVLEQVMQRRYERLQRAATSSAYENVILACNARSLGKLFANIIVISVVSVGAFLVVGGLLSAGALACSLLLAGQLGRPLTQALILWTQGQELALAKRKANMLFDGFARSDDTGKVGSLINIARAHSECVGAINVRDVSFSYDPEAGDGDAQAKKTREILRHVNLAVEPKTICGLEGLDGSGKTTLLKLMNGELQPQNGDVLIDGRPVNDQTLNNRRKNMAVVTSQHVIFRGSILENITMFQTGAAVDAARDAARLIGLEDDIHKLPAGYDTRLSGTVNDELSAGMLQRISIARSLARHPKILFFDDANTFLDARSDELLREGLKTLKAEMTIILVSQRPSLLKIADVVYTLADGNITPKDPDPVVRPDQQQLVSFEVRTGLEGIAK